MADFSEKLAALPAMSLRELRLLASRLGLGRYGALTRQSLVEAIRSRIGRPVARTESPTPEVSPPDAVVAAPALTAPTAAAPLTTPQPQPQPAAAAPAAPVAVTAVTPAAAAAEPPPAPGPVAPDPSWIVLQPQPDQWAEVRWHLAEADRAAAITAGGTGLALRLSDVTGSSGGGALPHALQEVTVDTAAQRWLLPIPLAGRSYRVELGFRCPDGWLAISSSAVVHLPELDSVVVPACAAQPFDLGLPALDPEPQPFAHTATLHERAYQAAAPVWRRQRVGSEAFQEAEAGRAAGAGAGQQASGAGLWASGLQESGLGGVPIRQRSFWLVADAELIVHAATEPSALLTIGDQPQPLSPEGTIRVHVPFPDGEQHYPIRALAADGEQSRHITLSFARSTPSARVNTPEQALPEWF
ncbi:MAG: DUF4912 domain-containing protein [Synechococcus sp.]|nr:DUF4912 domain-containing protein [Synechococcus sp.]